VSAALQLRACGVIPVVELAEPELAVPLAHLLSDAGLPAIEVTFRAAGAPQAIAAIRAAAPDVLVAAGTVLDRDNAWQALDAGAHLIVAPGTNPALIEFVLSKGGWMLPGVATPSEIEANLALDIGTMKLFPSELLGGVAYLRALAGPYKTVRFVPTGGISTTNLGEYLTVPSVEACGGTWIAPAEVLKGRDWGRISEAAREAAAIARAIRAGELAGSAP